MPDLLESPRSLRSLSDHSPLLSVSQAAFLANVSIGTIRNWDREGQIQVMRTLGGHRRVLRDSLLQLLGIEGQSKGKLMCVYLRVSSKNQKQAGSLERQKNRMLEWVHDQFSLALTDVLVVEDVASAFGARVGLQKVVDGIIRGEIGRVVAEHQDRLSRVGSELRLLEHLAKTYGCELIFAKQTIQDESDQAFMVRELVDFVTVICNRISSKKAADLVRADVPDEVVERARELLRQGYGLTRTLVLLRDEGYSSRIKGEARPLSYHVLRKRMVELHQLEAITSPQRQPPEKMKQFVSDCCVVGKQEKVWSDELFRAYLGWAREQDLRPLPRRAFVEQIKLFGFRNYRSSKSRRRWLGLRLGDSRKLPGSE